MESSFQKFVTKYKKEFRTPNNDAMADLVEMQLMWKLAYRDGNLQPENNLKVNR